MLSIDLKDACFQIPAHMGAQPCLCTALKVYVYQVKALCFCLSAAPQVFIRIFSLVLEWAHKKEFRLLCCLDDWLVILESVPHLLEHCNNDNNKVYILFAMSTYSFDEPKFTSAREK